MLRKLTPMAAAALLSSALIAGSPTFAQTSAQAPGPDGVVRVKSAYAVDETIDRLKKDVASKGILFFAEIDQSKLAAKAGVSLRRSTLLEFGNPPLGTLFLTSNPVSGLDWPVRLLVYEDAQGAVWAAYTDFGYIARRHGIRDRDAQFNTASGVIASITFSVAAKKE